nr:uncharacterized protein LOC100187156 [Ciona intestinalis]|eukprot:XP_002125813.1 uncharacterized protein LOC100187156 [Ciona intestinalis]
MVTIYPRKADVAKYLEINMGDGAGVGGVMQTMGQSGERRESGDEHERQLLLQSVEHIDCQDFPFDDVLSLEDAVKEDMTSEGITSPSEVFEKKAEDTSYLTSQIDFAAISHLSRLHDERLDDLDNSTKLHPLISNPKKHLSKTPRNEICRKYRMRSNDDVTNELRHRKRSIATNQTNERKVRRQSPVMTSLLDSEKQSLPPEGFKITRYPIATGRSMSASFDNDSDKRKIESQHMINSLVAKLHQAEERSNMAQHEAQEWRTTAQQTLKAAQIIKSQMEYEKARANRAEAKLSKVSLKQSCDDATSAPNTQPEPNFTLSNNFALENNQNPNPPQLNGPSSNQPNPPAPSSGQITHDHVRSTLRAKLGKISRQPTICEQQPRPSLVECNNALCEVMDAITSFNATHRDRICFDTSSTTRRERVTRKISHSKSDPAIYKIGRNK